jgi:mRNA degradation ribonuclease J1/J2
MGCSVAGNAGQEIIFQGGTETIGGNTIVLKATVGGKFFQYLFDFGVAEEQYQPHYVMSSKPDSIDEFRFRGLIPEFDLNMRACFITHAHSDHCSVLPALYASKFKPQAIWATRTTSRLISGVQFVEKSLLIDPFEKGDYYEDPQAKQEGLKLRVALYPVDHDIPGACCFFAVLGESLVVYTGDFRAHGFLSIYLEKQFWQYAKELQTSYKLKRLIVVCEGTNFGLPFDYRPQKDLDQRIKEILRIYPNDLVSLVINRDGLWDLFSVLVSTGAYRTRYIVISEHIAQFLRKIEQRNSFLEDYRHVVTQDGFNNFQYLSDPIRFQVYDSRHARSLELLRKIAERPSKYLLFLTRFDAYDALEKISIFCHGTRGCCILGFSGEDETAEAPMRAYAAALGRLGYCVEKTNVLARGHVSPHDLADILKSLKPAKVFLVHTLAPNGLKAFLEPRLDCEIIAPSKGVSYNL